MPDMLHSDSRRFRQITTNLVANAIKFTDEGRIDILCESKEQRSADADFVLSVQDSGIGIAEEDQAKLFIPFQQANGRISEKYGGTGLGLSISRKMAQALGGDLSLTKSQTGIGSQFTWILKSPFVQTQVLAAL